MTKTKPCKHCGWEKNISDCHVSYSIENGGCIKIIEEYDFTKNEFEEIEWQPKPKIENRGKARGYKQKKIKFRCVWNEVDGRESTEHPSLEDIRNFYPNDFPNHSSIKHFQDGRAAKCNFQKHPSHRNLTIEKL